MIDFFLFCVVVFFSLYYSNKSILNSFCFLLLSYFILYYNIGFQLKFIGVNSVLSFSRVYFLAFLIVYFYKRFHSKNKIPFIESKGDNILLLFLFYIFLTFFWGISFVYDLKNFFSERWLFGFGAYFIAKDVFRTKQSIIILFKFLFLALIILSAYGLIEFVTATPLMQLPFFRSLNLIDSSYESLAFNPNEGFVTRGSMLRLSGTFWNSIIFSIALTFLYPYYLLLKNFNIKYLKISFIPLTLVAILTIGRTAWFSMILALIFNIKKYKFLTFIAILLFIIIAIPFFNQNIENANYLDQDIFSVASRMYTLPILLEIPSKLILLGNGIGSYFYAVEQSQITIFTTLCGDNSLLQFLYIIGVIGALFLFIFIGNYYFHLKKLTKDYIKDSFEYNLLKGTQIVIIIQMILFMITNSIFQDTRLLFIFFSLLGAIKGYFNSVSNNEIIQNYDLQLKS